MREGKPSHDIASLTQAEKEKAAEREIAMLDRARKTPTKKPRFAEGTAPDLRAANEQLKQAKSVLPEDDFSDEEVTQVFERVPSKSIHDEDTQIIRLKPSQSKDGDIAGIMEGLDKAAAMSAAEGKKKPKSSKKEKKPAMIVMDAEDHQEASKQRMKAKNEERDRADAEEMAKAVEEARQEAEEVADITNMRKSGFEKKPTKDMQDEAEEIADLKRIRESLSAKKGVAESEKTTSIKNVREKISGVGAKKTSSKVEISAQYLQEIADTSKMEAQQEADKAQAAYAKAYTEYDPKFRTKLAKGNKTGDAMADYDLIAVTRPPRLAFLTAKGRELNRLYKDMQEKFRAAGKEQ